ncbi:MAG: zinc ribbon domain-containing protein [Polyangiaceae bacterium]|nr:zinc ribbon domain-containing protein [Polyangiaceae bacterium]
MRELDTEVAVYLPKAEALIQKHLKQKGLTQDPSPYREASRAASAETPAAAESGTDVEKAAVVAAILEDVGAPAVKVETLPTETAAKVEAVVDKLLAADDLSRVICEKCQTPNDTDAKFCKSCGQTMKKEEATDAT